MRAQRDQLMRELSEASRALDETQRRLDRHERKDVEDERELERLRAEVARLQRRVGEAPRGPSRMPWVALGLVGAVMTTGLVFFLLSAQPDDVVVTDRTALAPKPFEPPVDEPRTPAPEPTPDAPSTTELDRARFGAVVVRSVDRPDLPVGAGCIVDVPFVPSRGGVGLGGLEVRCSRELLYARSMSGGTEITTSGSGHREQTVGPGEQVYAVQWQDVGQRTGQRPQIAFDSHQHELRIWRDGASPFELRLAVDDRSASRRGVRLGNATPTSALERVHLAARTRARDVQGRPPAPLDDCELVVHPEGGRFDCRVVLRCGEATIYGARTSGFNRCASSEGRPTTATDPGTSAEDGDPRINLDLPGRTLEVSDEVGGATWSARFRLEPHPRCDFEGHWTGTWRLLGAPEPMQITLVAQGERATLSGAFPQDEQASVALDCERGRATLTLEGGLRVEGRFGAGFATFLGDVIGGPGIVDLARAPGSTLRGR